MSSGWLRLPDTAAPVPFGLKLCFSVSPKASCLTVSELLEALEPVELALALAGWELELEPELEHPAVPSRPAAMTVAPSQAAVRRLKMFTRRFLCDLSDIWCSGAKGTGERPMARRGPSSKDLVNADQRSAWLADGQRHCARCTTSVARCLLSSAAPCGR